MLENIKDGGDSCFRDISRNQLKTVSSISTDHKQVPKSPWITTDRKGANTFPFYNLPLEPEKYLEKGIFCAFFLSLLDKIKFGGDSCLRDILRKKTQNANQHSKK